MSATAPGEWGRRLSDRLRATLARGDLEGARRLAVQGDGQAKSLEKEYALMYKGLGITLRILLDLLGETVARRAGPEGEGAAGAVGDLLRRFRRELLALLPQAYPEAAARQAVREMDEASGSAAPGAPGDELARTARLLAAAEDLFSREQARLAQEAIGAMEAGDGPRARALLDEKERRQYAPLHDRLVRFMAEVFGFVLQRFGPAELHRLHRATAEGQRRGFEQWEQLAPAAFAQATAFLLKQHMGHVEVREDEEKYTIVQTPCGSGGRLRLAGAYEAPGALPFVEGPGALTAGEPRLPVYCSHCPIWNGVAPFEWFGRPHWVFEEPSRPDGSCTLHIYKRRDGAPAAYLRRLGVTGAGA